VDLLIENTKLKILKVALLERSLYNRI